MKTTEPSPAVPRSRPAVRQNDQRTLYHVLKQRARSVWEKHQLLHEHICITARPLETEEAIGHPEAADFPLQQGREKLMQAEFRGAIGQAFTDQYGNFEGTLEDIWHMPLHNNFRRAIFVATLNAVLRSVNQLDHTIHCRDQEPAECAVELAAYIAQRFGVPKLGQVGFQPRMIETLAAHFPLRVVDMDAERIGSQKAHILIEAPAATADLAAWADVLLVTGTTLVNDTLPQFLRHKPTVFYGTTIAGAASLMGWERFCAKSR